VQLLLQQAQALLQQRLHSWRLLLLWRWERPLPLLLLLCGGHVSDSCPEAGQSYSWGPNSCRQLLLLAVTVAANA
jgi:hypothetical protein